MRADIPDHLYKLIDEKIYLDLEIHILNKKMLNAEKDKSKKWFADYLDKLLSSTIKKRLDVNNQLKANGIKVFEAEKFNDGVDDSMFVSFKFYQKINGGYKEGEMRYWRAAIKLKMKKRMDEYFKERG